MSKAILYILIFSNLLVFGVQEIINYRLPRNIEPMHYNVTLDADLKDSTEAISMIGNVYMEFRALENTTNITLNYNQLDIKQDLLTIHDMSSGAVVDITSTESIPGCDSDFFVIYTDVLVKNNVYILSVPYFNATLRSDNAGLYIAKYFDENNVERSFLVTQFSAIGARKTFPCLDEPAMKATFTISLIRGAEYTSLSNGDLNFTELLSSGRYKDTFHKTPKMSTYILAFVISQLDYVNIGQHRVYGRPEAIKEGLGNYAVKSGAEILNYFSLYFRVPYTLSKMFQVAVPHPYFESGAMENWGLVTYRDYSLLVSANTSTSYRIQKAFEIIAHEFAHQWFGNLVTLDWWKYYWINEAFARYYEYMCTGVFYPEWRMEDQFVIDAVQSSMKSDYDDSPPMNSETICPVKAAPSYVSYEKGASILRMMRHAFTEEVFRNTVTTFLKKNAFGTAVPADFYKAFQSNVLNKNEHTIAEIMSSWTDQGGFPVVIIDSYNHTHLLLHQQKFVVHENASSTLWHIPINFAHERDLQLFSKTTPDFWMSQRNVIIEKVAPSKSWYIVNVQQTGYYRVMYDTENWNRLAQYLLTKNYQNIHVVNRGQLLDDSFKFAKYGKLPYIIPLKIGLHLQRETDYIPIFIFIEHIRAVRLNLQRESEYNLLRNYIERILEPSVRYYGYEEKENDGHLHKLIRPKIIKLLCSIGNVECRRNALQLFREKPIPPNLQFAIYCGAMRTGTEADWTTLFHKFNDKLDFDAKNRILDSLGCSLDTKTLKNYLDIIFSETKTIPSLFKYKAFTSMYSSTVGLSTILQYVSKNVAVLQKLGSVKNTLLDFGRRITTESEVKILQDILRQLEPTIGSYNRPVEIARNNMEWVVTYGRRIFDALKTLDKSRKIFY